MAALGGGSNALAQGPSTQHRPERPRRQSSRANTLPAGERALLGRVFGALSDAAPSVARPILAAGVADGTITQADQDRFLERLDSARTAELPRLRGTGNGGPTAGAGQAAAPADAPRPEGRLLFQRALAAIRAELPVVADPLLRAAVADGSITESEATRLRGRFERGPRLGFGLVLHDARRVGATRLP